MPTPKDAGGQAPQVLLCDCAGTMAPDAEAIAAGTGLTCSRIHRLLCRDDAAAAADALSAGPVIVACGQEAQGFRELAEDLGVPERLTAIDIRDRAGWSDSGAAAGPKMAALIAEGRLPGPPLPAIDIESAGVCLVWGPADVALPAAERLAATLTVTAMLTEPEEVMPPDGVAVVTGRVRQATGSLGRFEVTVDAFAELSPAGRGARAFGRPGDGAETGCDILVDLSGGQALFPAAHKRDGYLRADPGDPLAVARVLHDASHLQGVFEKPIHIRFEAALCAHSRARQPGCTRCLDVCPTGAIRPGAEAVAIDTGICAGCGACAAVCPTGAAASDEPPVEHQFRRLRTLAETFRRAGGAAPRLLVHDAHGAEMIRLAARYGRGLPADVIPLEVAALEGFGHAEALAALGLGFVCVDLLAGPRTERDGLAAQIALAEAIVEGAGAGTGAAGSRLRMIAPEDPDALCDELDAPVPAPHGAEPILAAGGRRDVTRLAATALAGGPTETPIPLPAGAPYGAIEIDTEACTLCLACVSLCPPGALGDNPEAPEVNLREEACVQCGICAATCPEDAIRLVPRLNLGKEALAPRVLHREEPFACIECGKLFGAKSTIEKITAKLSGNHAMFTNSDNVRLIQMCDDCRVRAHFHQTGNPFQVGSPRGVRTTQDYLDEREDD